MSEAKLSIRARQKLETSSLIHDIAEKLALSKGLAAAKVEDIADAAGISRRTFFNYFPTKEDAVLGIQAPSLPDGAPERFSGSSEDLLTRTVYLVMEVIRTSSVPNSSFKRRKELRKRFPELSLRFESRAVAAEKIVYPIVAQHLSKRSSDSTSEDIEIILGMTAAIIRYTYRIDHEIKDSSLLQSIQAFKTVIRKSS